MELLRASAYRRVAWKNGGGVTDVVAVASGARPAWRVSVARIERDGPFSDFAGYDRSIVSLGTGVALAFATGGIRALAPLQPFAFAGEAAVEARLSHGPASDLNVMTLRETCVQSVRAVGLGANGVPVDAGDLAGFLYVATGTVETDAGIASAGDTIRLEAGERAIARSTDGPATTILVRISAVRTSRPDGR